MLNKKILSKVVGIAAGFMVLTGCKALHIHDYTSPFEHTETQHWQVCSKCGEKMNEDRHYFNNFTDTCMVCGYKDPIFLADTEGDYKVMTGLTTRGKEKYEHDIPADVKFIAKGAFKDSKATKINLTKDFVGYYDGAFEGSNVTIINTEEEEVSWVLENGIYMKHDVLMEYDAMVDGVPYKTLSDALRSVKANDTTITILKDDLTLEGSYDIKYVVTLEPYHSKAKLNCDFNVYSAGVLNIPASITYTGGIRLLLTDTIERTADSVEEVYSSGAVAFVNRDTAPEGVEVTYVRSFSEDVENGLKAVGSKQVVNSVLVIPVTHYAYGSFVFSKDFKQVKGLSYYGLAISELYVTNIVQDIPAVISEHAFAIWGDIKINIDVIEDTHIKFYYTKGIFTKVTICDGITAIGKEAFTNWITDDVFHNIRKLIAPLLSHITSLTIEGSTCTTIGEKAFAHSFLLDQVVAGPSLTTISNEAFNECLNLKTVDLSNAFNLQSIGKKVFSNCDLLTSVVLPDGIWSFGGGYYFPQDITPEKAAYFMVHAGSGDTFQKVPGYPQIYYTKTLSKDGFGNYNDVRSVDDFDVALDRTPEGGMIYITDRYGNPNLRFPNNRVSKSVSIAADPNCCLTTLGQEGETLEIDANKYLTLSNITPLSKIVLHSSHEESRNFIGLGSFGIRVTNDGRELPNPNVVFARLWNEYKAEGLTASFNNQNFKTYGLFEFNLADEYVGIKGLSNFGGRNVSRMTIGSPVSPEEYSIDHLEVTEDAFHENVSLRFLDCTDVSMTIAPNAFYGCTSLEVVRFGSGIKAIRDRAFYNCGSLREVRLPKENDLDLVARMAFGSCAKLTYFDIGDNVNNWFVFNPMTEARYDIAEEDLRRPESTAILFTVQFVEFQWQKETK